LFVKAGSGKVLATRCRRSTTNAFQEGPKIEPKNQDCIEGGRRTAAYLVRVAATPRLATTRNAWHAMADPEIRQLMQDSIIQSTQKDMRDESQ